VSLHFYPIFTFPLFIAVSYDNKREGKKKKKNRKAHQTLKTWLQLLALNNFIIEIHEIKKIFILLVT
jgi:hypothetical protein